METGIRDLKDNLSRYIRKVEAGDRISITSHGRVVAELVPPATPRSGVTGQLDRLIAAGSVRRPIADGDPLEGLPDIRLPRGTAVSLISEDRGER